MFFFKRKESTVRELDYSRPFVVLNFKTYEESQGNNAIRLARIAEKISMKYMINIIVAVQAIDLKEVASKVKIPVYAQHLDSEIPGRSTGSIIPENIKRINVHGSLLNHSEKKLDIKTIEKTVLRMKELNLKSIVCVSNNSEAKKVSNFKLIKPDFIAIEPPELIGGENSVSSTKPEVIEKVVKICSGIPVLAGAGVKDNNDTKIALKLGCNGVLLSSHYVKSKDPEKFLIELIKDL